MTEYALVETRTINNTLVDGFYKDKDAWFTRTQIGTALGYADPQNAITIIHRKHRERLESLSRWCQIDTPSGVQEGYVCSFRGVLEICRWSKQPKANEVMDALYDMAESVREKGYFTYMSDNELLEILVDKCLANPALEVRLNKNYITGMKKLRLKEENENAQMLIREYARKCNALSSYYNKHPAEQGFSEKIETLIENALRDLDEQCPHLDVLGFNKSAIRLKMLKGVTA